MLKKCEAGRVGCIHDVNCLPGEFPSSPVANTASHHPKRARSPIDPSSSTALSSISISMLAVVLGINGMNSHWILELRENSYCRWSEMRVIADAVGAKTTRGYGKSGGR